MEHANIVNALEASIFAENSHHNLNGGHCVSLLLGEHYLMHRPEESVDTLPVHAAQPTRPSNVSAGIRKRAVAF